ncbi:unnamed protein product [Didymodactylos carnosus]|uniref:Uncharacterized protein n=1 Tax=Didymodactylos carnosus TaxID=1234261 RepID=A0A816BC11_9BILA|nr:unnamed protein product [Didymodactylos carnosus]CAF1609458.1 unnamed protein product [Didymodactylos carnosus]CAF4398495.1 unnamed protein product [Didymodactylos carnosus]CAF4491849.1 unnamed protein product [Didymodactylos carnosus]
MIRHTIKPSTPPKQQSQNNIRLRIVDECPIINHFNDITNKSSISKQENSISATLVLPTMQRTDKQLPQQQKQQKQINSTSTSTYYRSRRPYSPPYHYNNYYYDDSYNTTGTTTTNVLSNRKLTTNGESTNTDPNTSTTTAYSTTNNIFNQQCDNLSNLQHVSINNNNSLLLEYSSFNAITSCYRQQSALNKPLHFNPQLAELEAIHLNDIVYTIGNV